MTWRDVIYVRVTDSWGVEITVGSSFIILVVIAMGIGWVLFRSRFRRMEVVEAEVRLGTVGHVRIRPSYDDVQIAHKAWTELATRKAGLMFDEENDVIVEIYDSWYELFGRMRDLIKAIPAQQLRKSSDTRELVRVLVTALNKGLRPHLTCWQAKFRRWYEAELQEQKHKGASPQEIQKGYPQYDLLVEDLKTVNQQLVEYADALRKISQGVKA